MPLYEYECKACGHRTEVIQRVSDPPLADCPECDGEVRRLLSAPAVQFKGSGWYVTDYARKGASGEGEGARDKETAKDAAKEKDVSAPAKEAKDKAKEGKAEGGKSGGAKPTGSTTKEASGASG